MDSLRLESNSKEKLQKYYSTLAELINCDTEGALLFLKSLTQVYRYMIQKQKENLVSVKEEVDFVKAYFHLMHIRHSSIGLEMELTPAQLQSYMLPISIQLLAENAIKHNMATKERPLVISIRCDGNNLQPIQNPLPSMEEVKSHKRAYYRKRHELTDHILADLKNF